MSNRNLWIPSVEEESANGVREVALQTKHFMQRRLYLVGEINNDMAIDFVSQVMYLADQGEAPIHIFINSPGGSVSAGLMIYDVISSLKIPVNMYCMGMAASMAAVILAGGQKGRRFILPHSEMMIHEPLLESGAGGSATSIKRKAESILETKATLNTILAKHTGKSVEEIDKATAYDNYMNAEECIAFGLCDEIKEVLV